MQEQENSKNQEVQDNHTMTKLQDVFNLAHDQAHPDKIDAAIRANTRVSGPNMWVLMFAIAVASIGLNVNSTAVVIGAMLISPLMGPSSTQYYCVHRHQFGYRYTVFPANPAERGTKRAFGTYPANPMGRVNCLLRR